MQTKNPEDNGGLYGDWDWYREHCIPIGEFGQLFFFISESFVVFH
jgi:hypothetical protein